MQRTSSSKHRTASVVLQALLGVAALIAWVLIDGLAVNEQELGQSSVSALPILFAYEIGVFSRFLPGLDWIAKRIK